MYAASDETRPMTASDTAEHPSLAHALDVLAHLQRHPERLLEVDAPVERQQRASPDDRLPHARQLVQLLLAQPGDRHAHALGDLVGYAGQPGPHDLGLALARG